MGTMKYKVGDKVRIKSIDWYNKNKDAEDVVHCGNKVFDNYMSVFCGSVVTIGGVYPHNGYSIREDMHCRAWTDEMIEGRIEETKPKFKVGDIIISDVFSTKDNKGWKVIDVERTGYRLISVTNHDFMYDMDFKNEQYYRLVEEETKPIDFTIKATDTKGKVEVVIPEGYEYMFENGKLYFITKKGYPKTYGECCRVLGVSEFEYNHTATNVWYKHKLMATLDNLMLCRDAYWKLYGEEMGLGEPWKPSKDKMVYSFYRHSNEIETNIFSGESVNFEFPTAEMRDAFMTNFDKDIEICKELL